MAELNLSQIEEKLNAAFANEGRVLVFWYDDKAEFADDIDSLNLGDAKILRLDTGNQFYIKHFLECEDKETNYLIYAPFSKPDIRDNHLADTIRYSVEFHTDLASLVMADLHIDERLRAVVEKHIGYFADKKRRQRVYEFDLTYGNQVVFQQAIMSAICRNKTVSFEEIMRCLLTEGEIEGNKFLAEFEKYDLLDSFWQQVSIYFGYSDAEPTLEKCVISLFTTYLSRVVTTELPKAWQPFIAEKFGNVTAFLDNIMNSVIYSGTFDTLSDMVRKRINLSTEFEKMKTEDFVDCCIFRNVEQILIAWITERLENEDTGAVLNGKSIPELCDEHIKRHFGREYAHEFAMLDSAYSLISAAKYEPVSDFDELIKSYTSGLYKTDSYYRTFYRNYDAIEDNAPYEKLRDLVENIYTNDYLNKICVNWTECYSAAAGKSCLTKQWDFYNTYIAGTKEKTCVIISDALRYEVAMELYEKLNADEKCASASVIAVQGVLPSITQAGMTALLPHETLSISEDYKVLADGNLCSDTQSREAQLQKYEPKSRCVQHDDIKLMKKPQLREIFTDKHAIYVYHNQIDARGDKPGTENEVFVACEEAVSEIHTLMRKLTSDGNTTHFIITADHGFIYKRDKISESDKISGQSKNSDAVSKRYMLSSESIEADGVKSSDLGYIYQSEQPCVISMPLGSDIFKTPGGGQNYVHGGCSPQEMLVPVIIAKTEKSAVETHDVTISLVSLLTKVTNLIITLEFVQSEPVGDVAKAVDYKIFFAADDGTKISNENIVAADKKDSDAINRIFRLRFNLKNMQYSKAQKYYLVVMNEKNDFELFRREVIIDIAFADDFGF